MSPRTIPELNADIEGRRLGRAEAIQDAHPYRRLIASPYATDETRRGLERGIAASVSIARFANRQLLGDKRQIRSQAKGLAEASP